VATSEMVHVRVDKRVKARAAKALATMGLSVSDAVRVLLTRVATEKALPFEVKTPNAATAEAMRDARKRGLRSFDSVSGLMADLNAEDRTHKRLSPRLQAREARAASARRGSIARPRHHVVER